MKLKSYRFAIILLFLSIQTLKGQNAPVTSLSSIVNAVPNQLISVQVTVTNFNNIGSFSLYLDYDFSSLHFVSATINSVLDNAGNFAVGDNDPGNGLHRIIAGWYGAGSSLPDNSTILTIIFTYISGSTSLHWFDNGPSCAYTNASAIFLNDLPSQTYYKDGSLCGNIPDPGPVNGNSSIPAGTRGEIFSINPINTAKGYLWSVPQGMVITSGANTNQISVDIQDNAITGDISVRGINDCTTGPSSVITVTVTNLPTGISPIELSAGRSGTGLQNYLVYPNPVRDKLIIKPVENESKNIRLLFFSGGGCLIWSKEIENNDDRRELEVDVSHLSPALYYLIIKSGQTSIIKKIIKL